LIIVAHHFIEGNEVCGKTRPYLRFTKTGSVASLGKIMLGCFVADISVRLPRHQGTIQREINAGTGHTKAGKMSVWEKMMVFALA